MLTCVSRGLVWLERHCGAAVAAEVRLGGGAGYGVVSGRGRHKGDLLVVRLVGWPRRILHWRNSRHWSDAGVYWSLIGAGLVPLIASGGYGDLERLHWHESWLGASTARANLYVAVLRSEAMLAANFDYFRDRAPTAHVGNDGWAALSLANIRE